MAPELLARRPSWLGTRGWIVVGLGLAGVWAFLHLGLAPADLLPTDHGWGMAERFLGRAFSPALEHESATRIAGRTPIVLEALEALGTTVLYAALAMALAIVGGAILGFAASTAWWAEDPAGARSPLTRWLRRTIFPAIYILTRTLIAFMRSIHELFWALLFLVSIGLTETSAVLALAIPYTGILAKIFSEMADEAPRGPAHALRGAGASGFQTFAFGLLPAALPDMIGYAFYRFECALRSSAILGFFGVGTIGYLIDQSFHSTHYGEVWTYLYVLLAAILLFDAWSGAVRRRLVA